MIFKKFFFYIFLIFGIFVSNSYSENNISYINMDIIINESNAGKLIIQKLNKLNENNISELKLNEQKLKKMENDINKVRNVISEQELKIKINDLKKQIKIFRDDKENKVKEFNDIKQKEMDVFLKKVLPIIEEFVKINSIPIVIEKKNIFIANQEYDITSKVLILVNEKIK